ncbi:MAG: NFACT RNA binding domain-containing protein, partial [archaeon]
FRFSYSTNGFLIIGGRDSKDNELIVKKHMEDNDIYFHADIIGAPHTILKTEGKVVKIEDKIDAAIIAACYSSAWKNKIYSLDVYSALPSQVSKSPESGEYLTTGAFVIRGKKEYFKKCDLKLFIGIKDDVLIAGSENSIKKNCKDYIGLTIGDIKKTDICKLLQKKFIKLGYNVNLDSLVSILPAGDFKFI